MNITFKQCHKTNYQASRTHNIKYIVVHYTANNGDTAKGNASYFANNANLEASAHYFVDENEVYQSVKDMDTAWHCGGREYTHPNCRNRNSIGVELCSRKNSAGKYYFKDTTVDNAVEIVKSLMAKHNISIDNVIRHYDVTGKNCPAPFVEDKSQWLAFKKKLVGEEPKLTNTDKVSDWAKVPQEWVKENNISDGTNPKGTVTREELWTIIYRMAQVLK